MCWLFLQGNRQVTKAAIEFYGAFPIGMTFMRHEHESLYPNSPYPYAEDILMAVWLADIGRSTSLSIPVGRV